MSEEMQAVPEDHPLMKAWKAHQTTEYFANSKKWAAFPEHLQGSLWALFAAGFAAGFAEGRRQGLEESVQCAIAEAGDCKKMRDQSTGGLEESWAFALASAATIRDRIRALITQEPTT